MCCLYTWLFLFVCLFVCDNNFSPFHSKPLPSRCGYAHVYRGWNSVRMYSGITVPSKVCATLAGIFFVTLAGGRAPEASTLPPVTVSQFFSLFFYINYVKFVPEYFAHFVLGSSTLRHDPYELKIKWVLIVFKTLNENIISKEKEEKTKWGWAVPKLCKIELKMRLSPKFDT